MLDVTRKPWIKICCISSIDEARLAVSSGADAVGLVSSMPSGPGVIDEALIRDIARDTPAPTLTILLTSAVTTENILRQVRFTGVRAVQLVDSVTPGVRAELRRALPDVRILQVIHVVDAASVDEAVRASRDASVDALLLDSGNPALAVKELGGTGRVHDWRHSRAIVERSRVPVILAGGLRAENTRDALRDVGPAGLDICSGVRVAGKLDAQRLHAFIAAARA